MIWVKLPVEVVSWGAWRWQNRQVFEPALQRLGVATDWAAAVLTNPDGAVRRAGNTLIFGQADGGDRVLAYLQQTSPRIEAIEHAVDGLQAGQAALSSSLASLQTVSMVTLGLTALTPAVLGVQFVALNRRLGAIQKQIANLHKKFAAAIKADLETGLDLLRQGQDFLEAGNRPNARDRLTDALPFCHRTMKYYGKLLGDCLGRPKVSREEARLLARHLAVAVVDAASCQIGLEQDQHAFAQSGQELDLLRKAARWVFHDLVVRDPAPYLLPGMRAHGVTLDFMATLFQQARDAGAFDPAKDSSASAWFDEHREALVRASLKQPFFGSENWYTTLKGQLREAIAAVEETSRVVGLSRQVEEVRGSGRCSTLAVMGRSRQNAAGEGDDACQYAAWGFGVRGPLCDEGER
jgi:hypothetical protein